MQRPYSPEVPFDDPNPVSRESAWHLRAVGRQISGCITSECPTYARNHRAPHPSIGRNKSRRMVFGYYPDPGKETPNQLGGFEDESGGYEMASGGRLYKTAVLITHAVVGWAHCGALIGVGRQLLAIHATLVLHAIGAAYRVRFDIGRLLPEVRIHTPRTNRNVFPSGCGCPGSHLSGACF